MNRPTFAASRQTDGMRALSRFVPTRALSRFVAVVSLAVVLARCSTPGHDHGAQGAASPGHDHDHGAPAEGSGVAASNGEPTEYICPMHPQVRRPEPDRCPICHMSLVPVEKSDGDWSGRALALSEEALRLARVRMEPAQRGPLTREVRAFGRIEAPDADVVNLTSWSGGRVERLWIRRVGDPVRRGQRIATVYNPEVVALQEAWLATGRGAAAVAEGAVPDAVSRSAESARRALRARLELAGVPSATLDEVERTGVVSRTYDVFASAGGTVVSRDVTEGDTLPPGGRIAQVSGRETLWAILDVPERELPHLQVGQPVRLELPGVGGRTVDARVDFIYPELREASRTARVRVPIAGEGLALRTGMTVIGQLEVRTPEDRPPVHVPESAILWAGRTAFVYIHDEAESPPVQQPVRVTLGDRWGDRREIRDGLWEGERVLTNGAFRVDASLQIRGGESLLTVLGEEAAGAAASAPEAPSSGSAPARPERGGHDHAH